MVLQECGSPDLAEDVEVVVTSCTPREPLVLSSAKKAEDSTR